MSAATAAMEDATGVVTVSTEHLEPKKQEALALVHRAKQITIVDQESYVVATEMVKEIRSKRNWWKSLVAPVKEITNKAHKAACKLENDVDEPLELAEKQLTRAMVGYTQDQERIRQKAEQVLREEQARITQQVADQKAQEDQLKAAIEAEQQGDQEGAEAILAAPTVAAPVYVPPVVIASATPKVAGVSMRSNWQGRVHDESLIPREFMIPDLKKINAYAKAMKEQAKVPGIEFYDEASIAVRI